MLKRLSRGAYSKFRKDSNYFIFDGSIIKFKSINVFLNYCYFHRDDHRYKNISYISVFFICIKCGVLSENPITARNNFFKII